jgi:pyruvate dehydrogenase E1 component alpha subunit
MRMGMEYTTDFLMSMYETMLRIRNVEESFVAPILKGDIKCPVHLYSGEEAIATGVNAALDNNDYIFGTHRSHGHYIAKGGSMESMVAEIYGKVNGCSRGRGGSMHLIDPEHGMLGAAPIVAGTISLATGSALASSIRKDNRVTISYFGDGATGEGTLYESLNFAALKKLPIIYICENNLYSTHLPIDEIRVNRDIYKIGEPLGIKSFQCDGNDVLKVFKISKEAVSLCREQKGPVFIEFLTYRFRGHVGPDDNIQGSHTDIRPPDEVKKWFEKDPIKRFENYLSKNGISKNELLNIYNKVDNEVKQAHKLCESSNYPENEELMNYVFK